jgi:thiol peroxidase
MSRQITFKENKLTLTGRELKVGDSLPNFKVTGTDMADLDSSTFKGKALLIATVPSLDTPVCSIETKRFNTEIGKLGSAAAGLTLSLDLPFAQKRWCGAEGVSNVTTGSDYKYHSAGESLGVFIKEWALLGRAVFVVDKSGKLTHVEYVGEVSAEPNYEAAIAALKKAAA